MDQAIVHLTSDPIDAGIRALAAMTSWHGADSSDAAREWHTTTVLDLLGEDESDEMPGRLAVGLVGLSGQLLTICADLLECEPLAVLQAIAETWVGQINS